MRKVNDSNAKLTEDDKEESLENIVAWASTTLSISPFCMPSHAGCWVNLFLIISSANQTYTRTERLRSDCLSVCPHSSQSWATPFVTSVLSCQRLVTSPSWLLPYKFNTLIQWFDYPQCVQWEHSSYFYNCAQCTIRNITINLQLVGQGRGQPHCRKVMRPSLESWLCSFPFVTTLSITFPVILYLSSKIFYGRDILSMNISAL